MARRAQIRRRSSRRDQDPGLLAVPRRPVSDTRAASGLLDRIKRVLVDTQR